MFKNLSELKNYCKEHEIKMIDFKMIDLSGRWRHLTIPSERFTEKTLENGIGFDGSNYGYATLEKSDMVFIPDITTSNIEFSAEIPTISMIGDVYIIEDTPKPFDQDPRNIANKAEKYMSDMGVADEFRIGPEFEFYLFDHVSHNISSDTIASEIDANQAAWNNCKTDKNLGYKIPYQGGYHITPPMDVSFDFRSKLCMELEKRQIPVKYHHHEVGGPGQLEVEVEFGGLREMADKTMLAKYITKNAAFKEGKTATFMPKPVYGDAGNGLHVHMHMFKEGKPIFYDKNGYSGLSKEALYFIGGLLTHAASLCALTNPSTNSYKRLLPGYEAPVGICFATSNRSAVVRIPAYATSPMEKRFEIRSPDATCNPYFAYSAILMAGLDGIKKKIDPTKEGLGPCDFNLYNLTKEEQSKIKFLPKSLNEALDALEEDYEYLLEGNVFPKRLIDIWIDKKRNEAASINKIPHPAEFEHYYDL
ncbi:type I glutamate--ammonia ligase [Herbivorax sp. ANBcel31]|uniref:type I glutamate--ammonia ligase n=1 Tax=Herbivorax sp. ANBcel31 TaxID=3069754 RepID=UPI0027B2B4A4|nr:type I glutamate--ammonia ligase [Herbivorax sp. ANBcel31]MDQ2084902.1 type I glutamate--ammonia ligase [Herbivorax sp. ANBcel31]